jgi:hypothetical protein
MMFNQHHTLHSAEILKFFSPFKYIPISLDVELLIMAGTEQPCQ